MAVIVAIIVAVFVTGVSHQAKAASAEDFYKGKTIRLVVGFAAGGGFDSYARILARHMPKHTPGNPALIVDNMAGAGSRLAANYLYKASAPDGLTIGNFIGSLGASLHLSRFSAIRASNSTAANSNGSARLLRTRRHAPSRLRAALPTWTSGSSRKNR